MSETSLRTDLGRHITVSDALLQVRHEQEVTGFKEPVMKSVVVDMTQQGTCASSVRHVIGVDELAERLKFRDCLLVLASSTGCCIVLHIHDREESEFEMKSKAIRHTRRSVYRCGHLLQIYRIFANFHVRTFTVMQGNRFDIRRDTDEHERPA